MKYKFILFLLLLNLNIYGQYPIIENFNNTLNWSFNNGSGIQNYGGPENYATTNVGLNPYPNSSNIIIRSPIYNFSNCGSDIEIEFPLSGIIENNNDFLYLQYRIGLTPWITIQTFTGFQNILYSTTVPNTATQFRFLLSTNATVNTYFTFPPPRTNVYYYDISYFSINCNFILPVDFLEFNITCNSLNWTTLSETNNDYFSIYFSEDGYNYSHYLDYRGNSNTNTPSFYEINRINKKGYYKLYQTDYDGNFILLSNKYLSCKLYENKKVIAVYNILGQEINKYTEGIIIIKYEDGTAKVDIITNKIQWQRYQ